MTGSLPRFMTDKYHVVTGGETGAGKTHLANWCFARTDRIAVFWNSAHVEYVNGVECRNVEEVLAAFNRGYRRINVVPPIGCDEQERFERLRTFLFNLGNEGHRFLLIVDELHEQTSEGDKQAPGNLVWRKGRNYGIKAYGISQEFRTLAQTVLTQTKWLAWVGKPATMESRYFNKYGLPYAELKENSDHEYAVIRGGEIVERGTAPSEV